MVSYTIGEVATLAGVSVRTLHHYHEIGLLLPAHVGENGYRYYGRSELLRLQQILIHRELGLPLSEIENLLSAPDIDRLKTLKNYRERAARELARYTEMLTTIDRTIASLQGEVMMTDAALYAGIVDAKKQVEYDEWLSQRYGKGVQGDIEHSRRKMKNLSPSAKDAMMAELKDIEQALANEFSVGVSPQSQTLDTLIARHHTWVTWHWHDDAPLSQYAGLADMYLAHDDFVQRYESIAPGFAEFLAASMHAWVDRQR
jgi:MerR family transcriptional regulator, thiopeptide resistance regulator